MLSSSSLSDVNSITSDESNGEGRAFTALTRVFALSAIVEDIANPAENGESLIGSELGWMRLFASWGSVATRMDSEVVEPFVPLVNSEIRDSFAPSHRVQ